jgi:hypothetical protein
MAGRCPHVAVSEWEKEENMFRLSKWIILVLLVVLGTSVLFLAGCKGGKVTVTIPPITLTAPPVTHSTTITTTGETTTPITPSGLVPVSVTLSSLDSNNKTQTMHTLVATILSENGTPVPGVTVQWTLNRAPDSVGDIVSLGGVDPQMDNTWGSVKTDSKGQARLAITSVHEGDTYIMVYVAGISSYDNRRIYTVQHWILNTN